MKPAPLARRLCWLAVPWILVALWACSNETADYSGPTVSLPVQVGPFDTLAQRYGRLRQRIERRGYERYAGPSRILALEEAGTALPIDLPTTHCTTFVALAGGTVRELEVELFDGEGVLIAQDTAHAEAGLLHVCPQAGPEGPKHAPYHLSIRASTGSGAVIVEGFRPDRPQPEGFDDLFDGIIAPRVPMRQVEGKLARARSSLGDRGWLPLHPPILSRLAERDASKHLVQLEAGHCYAAIVRSAHGVKDIALFLLDPSSAEIARDLSTGPDATLQHCARETGRYALEVRVFEGAGGVGVQWMRDPTPRAQAEQASLADPPSPSAPPAAGEASSALHSMDALSAVLSMRGYASRQVLVSDGRLSPGEVIKHEVLLVSGCSVITALAAEEVLDIDLYLTTPEGRLLDRDTGLETGAQVGACTPRPAVFRIIAKAYGREGSYALGVFAAPPSIRNLQSLRLEQARATFIARGYRERWRDQDRLTTGQTLSHTTEIAAGTCAAWIATGDQGIRDVDLFVRDAQGQLLVSETAAAPHASATRCVEETQRVHVQASVFDGEGEVVLTQLVGEK